MECLSALIQFRLICIMFLWPPVGLAGSGGETRLVKNQSADRREACYQANSDFVTRIIAGELVLVPVGEQAQRLSGMITFSETGAFLWDMLSQRRTKTELVTALVSRFDQDADTVEADVSEFLEKAEKRGLVVRHDAVYSASNNWEGMKHETVYEA